MTSRRPVSGKLLLSRSVTITALYDEMTSWYQDSDSKTQKNVPSKPSKHKIQIVFL